MSEFPPAVQDDEPFNVDAFLAILEQMPGERYVSDKLDTLVWQDSVLSEKQWQPVGPVIIPPRDALSWPDVLQLCYCLEQRFNVYRLLMLLCGYVSWESLAQNKQWILDLLSVMQRSSPFNHQSPEILALRVVRVFAQRFPDQILVHTSVLYDLLKKIPNGGGIRNDYLTLLLAPCARFYVDDSRNLSKQHQFILQSRSKPSPHGLRLQLQQYFLLLELIADEKTYSFKALKLLHELLIHPELSHELAQGIRERVPQWVWDKQRDELSKAVGFIML